MDDPRVQLLAELADPLRFAALERLERGPASARELGETLAASPTQLANHLRRLREAGLVHVRHEGRLAIYELAEPGLREIFSMLNGLRGTTRPRAVAPPAAATCYDHLAGRLGVALLEHLVAAGALQAREGEGELRLGREAPRALARLGVEVPSRAPRRMLAFACMDSLVGRPHLGGLLGAELAAALRERGWVEPGEQPRRLELTARGRAGLRRYGVVLAADG